MTAPTAVERADDLRNSDCIHNTLSVMYVAADCNRCVASAIQAAEKATEAAVLRRVVAWLEVQGRTCTTPAETVTHYESAAHFREILGEGE